VSKETCTEIGRNQNKISEIMSSLTHLVLVHPKPPYKNPIQIRFVGACWSLFHEEGGAV